MGIMAKAGSFFPKTTWRDTVVSRIWIGWPRTKQRQKRSPHSNKWAAAAGSTNSLGLLSLEAAYKNWRTDVIFRLSTRRKPCFL